MHVTDTNHPLTLSNQLLNLLTVALGIAAAYFLTIQSLKIELAAKAESRVVEVMDKKLTSFEVLVREGLVSKEDFYTFSRDIDSRLTRIELFLTEQSGAKRETP